MDRIRGFLLINSTKHRLHYEQQKSKDRSESLSTPETPNRWYLRDTSSPKCFQNSTLSLIKILSSLKPPIYITKDYWIIEKTNKAIKTNKLGIRSLTFPPSSTSTCPQCWIREICFEEPLTALKSPIDELRERPTISSNVAALWWTSYLGSSSPAAFVLSDQQNLKLLVLASMPHDVLFITFITKAFRVALLHLFFQNPMVASCFNPNGL